ncbi:MAG TPA: VCBS repeat-containing protein, partial [Terriglobia bacterium]|nr:VCBS repeat-containing protein [Terriglobia bacterium]
MSFAKSARRKFLKSMSAGLPAAALLGAGSGALAREAVESPRYSGKEPERGPVIDLGSEIAGDDAIAFRKHTLDLGCCETVTVADINRDGRLDIVSGENWYEQVARQPGRGPRFIKHKFRDIGYTDYYLEDLSDLAIDVTGNGYPDIVTCSYWSKTLTWWENPGASGGEWRERIMDTAPPVEFAFLVDILNTGKPLQVLPQFGANDFPLKWYELAGAGAADPWVKHEVSPMSWGHGIGAGDVNSDNRTDIITPRGWFEAPPDPRNGQWIFHPEFNLGDTGFIFVEDVNRDGVPDLLTSLGHEYGIFWLEQKRDAAGRRRWEKHLIDDGFSQAHAMTLVDLNGDGRRDIVTGKRFYAHEHDPGANEPLGLYWYEPFNSPGRIQWRRHIIDYSTRTGAGLQIPVVDIDGDGDMDIV